MGRLFFIWNSNLLRAGIAHHFYIGDLQMTVLLVFLCHAGIVGHVFCIFFHVVRGRVRNHAGSGYLMSDMLGQHHRAATQFPCAAVVRLQIELFRTVAL